jgi:hypothetical protein
MATNDSPLQPLRVSCWKKALIFSGRVDTAEPAGLSRITFGAYDGPASYRNIEIRDINALYEKLPHDCV